MASLPRILTVDPTGRIPQQVRGAIDLMDRLITQIDVPDGTQALEELKRGKCTAVICAWVTGDQTPGWFLAASINRISPETPVIILADLNDPELDESTRNESPYVYLRRPFDIEQFFRVLTAAIDGENVFAALKAPETANTPAAQISYGPVPTMNQDRARGILQQLLTDLNALGVLLCSRDGHAVLELGVIGLERDVITQRLSKAGMTNIELKDMIGGNTASLQYFDGDSADLYVLSVGFHYFVVLVFQDGARQLGNVRLLGRRAAEDLVALMGAEAWLLRREMPEEKAPSTPRRSDMVKNVNAAQRLAEPEPVIELARAEISTPKKEKTAEYEAVEIAPLLDAIPDEEFNLDDIFGSGPIEGESDDFFSLENLEELARADSTSKRGMTWEDAEINGILGRDS